MEHTGHLILSDHSSTRSVSVRDLLAIGFRRKRVLVRTFFSTALLGVALALLLPLRYRSEMKFLLEKNRLNPAVSGTVTQPNIVSEDELNSEVELLNSQDLLRQVVVSSRLDLVKDGLLSVSRIFRHDQEFKTAKAIRQLGEALEVEPARKTNVLVVSYASADPQLSYTVMMNVEKLYLEKYAKVHHSEGELQFFEQQKEQLWKELSDAEAKLAAFPAAAGGVISGQMERDVLLQKLGDLKMAQQTTVAEIGQTSTSIAMLRKKIAETPARMTTQLRNSDNPQLMQQLKGTLLDLELKRSALLEKYEPTYRPVLELERQIAIARESIAGAEKAPLHDITTDNDPTHEWMKLQLAKDETDLRGLQGRAAATTESMRNFEENARKFNTAAIEQQNLIREAKALEDSYQLYVRKAEEARINKALDLNSILNVSVAEPPTFPVLPQHSRVRYLAMALALAFVAGTGSVVISEYLDKSFHTPHDVQWYLNVPVYAALPARPLQSTPPTNDGTR